MATMPPDRRRRGRLVWRNTVAGWSFILPNFVGFAVLTLVPVGGAVLLRLHQLERLRRRRVDRRCDNFRRMWDDASFWTALRNTVYYTAFHIPLTLAAALGLALLLNR